MRSRLRYSTDHATILHQAHERGRPVGWVIKSLLAGVVKSEQKKTLKDWVDAFREVYGIADYEALLAEARRCGFFTSST